MSSDQPPLSRPRFVLGLNDTTFALSGVAILLLSAVFWSARGPNVEKTDFSLTFVGAKIVHDGRGRELYDLNLQKQIRNSLYQHPVPLLFEHPPFEALLLSPLAGASFRTAYLIWGLANAAILAALIFLLRPHLPWPTDGLGYVCLWLLFVPLWVALYQGQSSLVLLAAYAVTYALLKSRKSLPAGIALGLGLFKFQFVVPFAVIFLVRKQWRFLAGLLTSAVLLVFASVIGIGWKGVTDYGRFLAAVGNDPQNISYGSGVDMPTIHGFVFAIVGRRVGGTALNFIVAGLVMALLAWVAVKWKHIEGDSSFDLMFATAVAASLLSGSHMFMHDFSPLILAMLLSSARMSHYSNSRNASWARFAIRFALSIFWIPPIYFLFVKWHCLYLMGPVLFLFVWGVITLAKRAQPIVKQLVMATG